MNSSVSVVIATRDRRAEVGRVVRSVLANPAENFDLTIIDRVTSTSPPDSLQAFLDDPRLCYLQTDAVASTRAHNQAILRACGEIIGVTDDDCEVSRDWIEAMRAAFKVDERIGVVFGNVHPASDSRDRHLSPAYLRPAPFLANGVRDKPDVNGIWACMALTRSTWERLGGFDEYLGAGARFPGAADGDLAIRALDAGISVYESPVVSVVHHRLIPPEQRTELAHRYSFATGAMVVKHLRCRTRSMGHMLFILGWRWFRGRTHRAMTLGADPHRGIRLGAFTQGFAAGMKVPVDLSTKLFRPLDGGASP